MTDEQQSQTGQENVQEQKTEETQPVDVWGLLNYCILLLHSHAWQTMGLMPMPGAGTVTKDLEQARVAIDAAAALASQLEAKLSGQQLRDLRTMISDLRLNFVNQQKATEKQ